MGALLKVGLAAALLGIAAGVLVSVLQIQEFGDLLTVQGFALPALGPLLLGAVAIVVAVIDSVQRERFRPAATIFVLGLAAIATPFLFGFVVVALLVILLLVVIAHAA
jgi:hypothetical protein